MDSLEASFFYHIYNRGNNKEVIFFDEENYDYFLSLLKKHVLPIAEVYCYCLLPNHFHLLVRIKDETIKPSQGFSNLFNAYTKAINKKYKRTGSILQKPFKRIRIIEEKYLKSLVVYIHQNPENHNIVNDFKEYSLSSYKAHLSKKPTSLERRQVINWFNDEENFIFTHSKIKDIDSNLKLE